ncbi:GGDEF domain-containing protein [Aliiglaciecola sp. M165]|uniref:GGDEF domain-containing protein n=1 Tax=Aliiglaciecola sp. M165 TaxID=2593649 RepID=UPI00117D7F9F|nr:GGDEF domain-containing protein [Aliiglaciecola sp. M165]TRY31284.1 GGDEF domain-containing protein [Aliiglaciecola sp. M165]
MSTNQLNQTALLSLLNQISDATAMLDQQGNLVFSNAVFDKLPEQFKHSMLEHSKQRLTTLPGFFDFLGYKIKMTREHDYTSLIVDMSYSHRTLSVFTLKHMTDLLKKSDDIYYAAAKAIQDSLGWKWVAITRFREKGRLEVLSYLDNYLKVDNFEYDIVGTPCQAVVDTNRFTMFEDVTKAFPNYQALQDLGVKTYAGLVFRGPNGKPIGHIMAMHDSSDVNFAHAEEVIDIATMALSSHFQLRSATDQLEEVKILADKDPLTGIANRSAYEKTLEKINSAYKKRVYDDWSIAIIDLDHLKPLNDSLGHKAGDQFIRLMAVELSQLGRQTDSAFRIGGDEFALLFSQNATPFIESILARFNNAISRISKLLNFPVGASIGFAALSETQGDTNQWVQLADHRMYQDKRNKKQVVS